MARSSQGGTRGFLRGKVAQDMFQVTKDARGRKIQIVKAYEAQRENPNTILQALARMRMALCMGSLSQFKALVDHSWETIPYGQLSIAHFVKLNMPLIEADSNAHWYAGSQFDYPEKGITAVRVGPWIMSEGSLTLPSSISTVVDVSGPRDKFYLKIHVGSSPTYGKLRQALGASAGDYITALAFWSYSNDSTFNGISYVRCYLAQGIADGTPITAANVADMFTYDGNTSHVTTLSNSQDILVQILDPHASWGRSVQATDIIISKWDGVKWCRNNSQFTPPNTGYEPWPYNNAPDGVFTTWYPDYNGEQPT